MWDGEEVPSQWPMARHRHRGFPRKLPLSGEGAWVESCARSGPTPPPDRHTRYRNGPPRPWKAWAGRRAPSIYRHHSSTMTTTCGWSRSSTSRHLVAFSSPVRCALRAARPGLSTESDKGALRGAVRRLSFPGRSSSASCSRRRTSPKFTTSSDQPPPITCAAINTATRRTPRPQLR